MSKCFVVGDYFADFLQNDKVISVQDFLEKVKNGKADLKQRYIFGQGIDDEEINDLQTNIDQNLYPEIFAALPPARTELRLTHKHKSYNNLVSDPKRISEANYELQMVIDDKNDIMADHLTGQHIQGVLLIEAARQAWTAVTEKYHFVNDNKKYRFVIENIKTSFKHFVFPFPIVIKLTIATKIDHGLFYSFQVVVDFYQGEKSVALVEANYKVILEQIAEKQEMLARKTIFSSLLGSA
jgi:hypothetical protein